MFNAAGLPPFTDGGLRGNGATSVRLPSEPHITATIPRLSNRPERLASSTPSGNVTLVDATPNLHGDNCDKSGLVSAPKAGFMFYALSLPTS